MESLDKRIHPDNKDSKKRKCRIGIGVKRAIIVVLAPIIFLLGIFFFTSAEEATNDVPVCGYEIVNIYPHDRNAFTQGLIFENGYLYEGTGLYGQSTLRKVELKTGKVLKLSRLPAHYFGEGVTSWKDELIQLTWRERKGFVYEKESLRLLRKFSYPTEGWGITQDSHRLIISDGSATLYFLDPDTFEQIGKIEVRAKGIPVTGINELEYVKGKIYANIWLTDRIAIVSPETGLLEGWIDLRGLLNSAGHSRVDTMNGIAYDKQQDRLFVTGKLWPKLFEIKIILPHLPLN